MASRTDSDSTCAHTLGENRTPSKRLKDVSALIYNYVKPIPIALRPASDSLLFSQIMSIIDTMTETEKATYLKSTRNTRSGAGPPIPTSKQVADFTRWREAFLNGDSDDGRNKRGKTRKPARTRQGGTNESPSTQIHRETMVMAEDPPGAGSQGIQPAEGQPGGGIDTQAGITMLLGLGTPATQGLLPGLGAPTAQGLQPAEWQPREGTDPQMGTTMPPSSTSTGHEPQTTRLTTPAMQELQATSFPTMMAQAVETALRGAAVGARVIGGISSLANAALT